MTNNKPNLIGAHFSIAGGLENALKEARQLNCGAIQIFTKNARSWKETQLTQEQIKRFKILQKEYRVSQVFSHCSYLINIASDDPEKLEKSRLSLEAEMIRSGRLGLDGVVLHPGAHLGRGVESGLKTAVESLAWVMDRDSEIFPRLLIETTAGTGTCIGSRFEEIRDLISGTGAGLEKMGVCLDTSHVFSAGYDIRTYETLSQTLADFDEIIGLDRLFLIHANDSKPALGSRRDRHEHIGRGKIGKAGFSALMVHPLMKGIPKILETPKKMNGKLMDPVNLDILRELGN